MCSRVYLHLNTRSEPGKLATTHDSPRAHARDLVPVSENKCGPSMLGLPARILTDAGIGGWTGGGNGRPNKRIF
jgi:hypothetical protein